MSRLEKILRPKSIAVIGASRKPGSLGKMFLEAVLRMKYTGNIYPVNPNAAEIDGLKAYPSVAALPEKPDIAVILLSYTFVLQSLEELGRAGVQDVIVISAGFKEIGTRGAAREQKLVNLARKYQMNLLGPNCMGVFNTDAPVSFNGTFSPTLPKPGHVAYISQSGALAVAVLELNAHTDLGFSVFVSTGNKADLNDTDALEFLADDENSKVVTLYLESIDRARDFGRACRMLAAKKPVLALKAGRTASGLKAASSHTGALANPDYLTEAFLKQNGVLRLDTLEDLFDAARGFSLQPLPEGPEVAIVTNAGGPGILASDAVERAGLKLARLSKETIKKLQAFLPAEAATGNPVDMIASANDETYGKALEIVLQDAAVKAALLIIVKPPVNTTPAQITAQIASVVRTTSKTVIPVLMAQRDEQAGLEEFAALRLPVYSYPESAAKVLGSMWQYRQIRRRMQNSAAREAAVKSARPLKIRLSGQKQAAQQDVLDLLKTYQISFAPCLISSDLHEIVRFQKKQGGKLVLKTANEEIIHKSDEGLLKLNLKDEASVLSAFEQMDHLLRSRLGREAKPLFMAQKQMPPGLELVLGGKRDAQFGSVVMVGFGGIFIEVLKDVVFRIAPLSEEEALHMLDELRAQALFTGTRGLAPIDKKAFARTIHKFSLLLAEHPEIVEMDLNPLIWSTERHEAVVVDMRATID